MPRSNGEGMGWPRKKIVNELNGIVGLGVLAGVRPQCL